MKNLWIKISYLLQQSSYKVTGGYSGIKKTTATQMFRFSRKLGEHYLV